MTELMSDPWKEEYAPALKSDKARPVYHNVHPHVPNRAHCYPTVRLDMEKVVTGRPAEGYCQKCWLRGLHYGKK